MTYKGRQLKPTGGARGRFQIVLCKRNYRRLASIGTFGESFNDVMTRVLDAYFAKERKAS